MTDTHTIVGEAERRSDFYEGKPSNSSDEYREEIRAAKKRTEDWAKRAETVVKRYDNEKKISKDDQTAGVKQNYNILWSNTEVLKGATYSASAKPDIRRRFPDRSVPAARVAAEVLERAVRYNCEEYNLDSAIELAVHDALVPGHGVCRVRFEQAIDDDTDDIYDQHLEVDWTHWKDFLWSSGRAWRDVYWVGFRHLLTRQQLENEFGKEHGGKVPLNTRIEGGFKKRTDPKPDDDDVLSRAEIWEIWDKRNRTRLYVSEHYDKILREDEDPYNLKDFFPCGEPLAFNRMSGSLVPVPEYTYYQDQAREVDLYTTRINSLTGYLKHVGVYDSSAEGSNELKELPNKADGQFVPVKNLAGTLQKSGSPGSLATVLVPMDVTPISVVVQNLIQQRQLAIQGIYEVTGISDVIRGASDPNETATAQRIKGQFGSMRLQRRQTRVQRFIRDLFRIKAEIIAEWFTPDTLMAITGVQLPTEEDVAQAEQEIGQLQAELERLGMMQEQAAQAPEPMTPEGPAPEGEDDPPPDPYAEQMEELEGQIDELQAVVDGPNWPQVMDIIRSDERRAYAIDIQTDSTVQADEAADREARNTFLEAFQGLMQTVIGAAETYPQMIPLLKELTMFTMHGYKIGRQMEETVEDAFDDLQAQVNAPPEEAEPDPQMEQAAAELDLRRTEVELKAQVEQLKLDADMQRVQFDAAADQRAAEQKLAADQAKEQRQLQIDIEKLKIEREKLAVDREKIELERQKYLQDRIDQGLPEQEEISAVLSAVGEQQAEAVKATVALAAVTQSIHQSTQQLAAAVGEMMAQEMQPVTIIRDENNNPIGIQKGNVTKQVVLDETGSVAGLQ